MSWTANKLSIRERLLVELERRFKKIVKGAPSADPYTFEWATVQREPLSNLRRKNHEMSLVDRTESKTLAIQNYECVLDIELEFSSLIPHKNGKSTWANEVITQITRKLNEDIYMTEGGAGSGGDILALRIYESGSDFVIDDENDPRIEGIVNVHILYKHKVADPRDRVG